MNHAESIFNFPDLTAAQIASMLGISPQAIRKALRAAPATGERIVGGNRTAYWNRATLPAGLRMKLISLANAKGCVSVYEMFRNKFVAWIPRLPLAEAGDDAVTQASKLKQALLPSLQRHFVVGSQSDFEREGVADYAKIFGHTITNRHFRSLIKRTVERDGGRGNFERLELYLSDRPARKDKPQAEAPDFPFIAQAIREGASKEIIWQKTFAAFDEMINGGETRNRAVRQLRDFLFERLPTIAPSRATLSKDFNRKLARHQAGETFDKRAASNGSDAGEMTQQINSLPWFLPAARFFYLLSNRTADSGSMPEAVRRVISLPNLPAGWIEPQRVKFLKAIGQTELPTCPAELREAILARERAGAPLVPAGIARQIIVNPSIVQYFRSQRAWSLQNQSAPGSQRRFFNKETGQREIMRPGDWFGGDDATPGIAICVPCKEVVSPVSEKFGVLLGRFQWLAYHDCRADKILAWDYVIRPRGSYRAEDILNGMGAVCHTHGIPRKGFQFEGGTFNANLVKQAIQLLGCEHWRTHSPHAKSIEAVFNKVWTQLAIQFPHADMGRYRNENEANCKLYEACKAGHKDPRRYFPTLALVVKAFEEGVARHNGKTINSRQYGRWIPDELFQSAVQASPLRSLAVNGDWIFSPYTAERIVKGMTVSCRVSMFEKFSVPFDFGADWLPQYHGQKVRLHFNPRQPRCVAKVVLVETGEVLGDAQLVGETAQHIRFILDWGDDDQRAGYLQRQRVGNFIRRETRGIGAAGRVEYSKSEERDGLERVGIVEKRPSTAETEETPAARRLAQNLAAIETTEDRRATLADLTRETEHLFA